MRNIKEMDKRLDEREQEIERLQQENKQLSKKIDILSYWVKETIDIIEKQPTTNDEFILERLYSFMSILWKPIGDKENE